MSSVDDREEAEHRSATFEHETTLVANRLRAVADAFLHAEPLGQARDDRVTCFSILEREIANRHPADDTTPTIPSHTRLQDELREPVFMEPAAEESHASNPPIKDTRTLHRSGRQNAIGMRWTNDGGSPTKYPALRRRWDQLKHKVVQSPETRAVLGRDPHPEPARVSNRAGDVAPHEMRDGDLTVVDPFDRCIRRSHRRVPTR